jgi:ribosomal protein S18 acetylase RimI-like enzyme
MWHIERIAAPPANFDDFVEEVAVGLSRLHGPAAGKAYRRNALSQMALATHHPDADVIAALDGPTVAGLLVCVIQERIGRVTFIHVLGRYAGKGAGELLVREAVTDLRARGVEGIIAECVPCCALDLGETYQSLDFGVSERALMTAPLDAPGLSGPETPGSGPCDGPAAAAVICDAYARHPERNVHAEVRDLERATAFVARAMAGVYGPIRPAFARVVTRGKGAAGIILGCEVFPSVGFVLYVAVRPAFQGQGIGTGLMRDLAGQFRSADFREMTLGVTASSPAKRLYERLGFCTRRNVDAYYWWAHPGTT